MLDLGIDLNVWPWVWLGIAVIFAGIELTVLAGSFVLLPFAISAFGAALLGFYEVPIELQWLAFLGGGGLLWIILYRYAQHFVGANEVAPGVGADRIVGLDGIVTAAINPDDTDRRGRVTVHGEVWGALSSAGTPIERGAHVRVVGVSGTRAVVESTDREPNITPSSPPTAPPPIPPNAPPDTSTGNSPGGPP